MSLRKSPWVMHFDTGSCNGCDMEIWALLTPYYDIERFGAINAGNPKHADVLLLTGPVNKKSAPRLKNLYDQVPEPKVVVAVGDCASTGAPFQDCYNTCGGISEVIPVDVFVQGCAARPEAIIEGFSKAVKILEEKRNDRHGRERGDNAAGSENEGLQSQAGRDSS